MEEVSASVPIASGLDQVYTVDENSEGPATEIVSEILSAVQAPPGVKQQIERVLLCNPGEGATCEICSTTPDVFTFHLLLRRFCCDYCAEHSPMTEIMEVNESTKKKLGPAFKAVPVLLLFPMREFGNNWNMPRHLALKRDVERALRVKTGSTVVEAIRSESTLLGEMSGDIAFTYTRLSALINTSLLGFWASLGLLGTKSRIARLVAFKGSCGFQKRDRVPARDFPKMQERCIFIAHFSASYVFGGSSQTRKRQWDLLSDTSVVCGVPERKGLVDRRRTQFCAPKERLCGGCKGKRPIDKFTYHMRFVAEEPSVCTSCQQQGFRRKRMRPAHGSSDPEMPLFIVSMQ